MRIAVVGSGISGLVAATRLARTNEVTIFEKDARAGGHTNTVTVEIDGTAHAVDTGFIVHNAVTYPGFCSLLDDLGIPVRETSMSFSVMDDTTGIEWRGSSLATVFAQRRYCVNPEFLRMLWDLLRFNRCAHGLLGATTSTSMTLREFCTHHHLSDAFTRLYLIPLMSAIWSADPVSVLDAPARYLLAFLANHGLLQLRAPFAWRTIPGGAHQYVDALITRFPGKVELATPVKSVVRLKDGVRIVTAAGSDRFDHVVLACHSNEALDLLERPSLQEEEVLGALRYQENNAVLHTDASLLPKSPKVRASWNARTGTQGRAHVTYSCNRLQGLHATREICITLNAEDQIAPHTILGRFTYAHPIINEASVAAQARWDEINGVLRTWYCGAYWGYGFHEDGFQSACRVAEALGGAG